jgi:hypothetical protein
LDAASCELVGLLIEETEDERVLPSPTMNGASRTTLVPSNTPQRLHDHAHDLLDPTLHVERFLLEQGHNALNGCRYHRLARPSSPGKEVRDRNGEGCGQPFERIERRYAASALDSRHGIE